MALYCCYSVISFSFLIFKPIHQNSAILLHSVLDESNCVHVPDLKNKKIYKANSFLLWL
jgi:hypothetical protein